MSDSDDTDFLLFIPPNFFNVSSSESSSPIDRLSYVEDMAISSYHSVQHHPVHSINNVDMKSQSIPLLNRSNGKTSSSYSFNIERSNEQLLPNTSELSPYERDEQSKTGFCYTWPVKTNEVMCKMGDEMKLTLGLDNNSYKNAEISRSTEISPSKTLNQCRFSKFNLSQVDQLLIEMEKTRAEIKNKLQSNKNKIHEMRRECLGGSTDMSLSQSKDNNIEPRLESPRSFETSKQISDVLKGTDTNVATDISNGSTRNQLNFEVNFPFPRGSKNMLQLSQIMSAENNAETLQQKLEAEILKKKHCEEMIQELQSKVLELEQNLSVAQKIDTEKEEIIKQLQNAWLQLVEHWKELEQQRQELALMLEQERIETRNMNLNFSQKVETLENRLHETISLASGYRQKNEELEKSLKKMQESIVEFEDNFKKTEEYAKLIELEKSNMLEQLRQTNENLTAEKQKSFNSEIRIADLENQITALTSEKNDLLVALREEKNNANNFKAETNKLREDYSRVLNAESLATQQMSSMKQEISKAKNNLKDFYQNQLDVLVKKKVEEFQKEFHKAQNAMRQELLEHERIADERLQSELKQLQDSNRIELSEERRVNQKHVNILKTELKESRKKIHELENRLKSDSSSKAELAKRVQSVLRTQWMEALNVISGNDDLSKDFLSLNLNMKNVADVQNFEHENESSDFDLISNKSHKVPLDLQNYISMLLHKEPGNPVDDYKTLEFLLSGQRTESYDKKSSEVTKGADNFRRKPPWK